MTAPAYARGDDLLPMLRTVIDPGPLLYRWRNSDRSTRGIAEIGCELRDGRLFVTAVAVGPGGPVDWGEVEGVLYTDISSTGAARGTVEPCDADGRPTPHYGNFASMDAGPAFEATFDHGFLRVRLQARINLGLLVVAIFNEFTDDSGRADYFVRDCYVR